ncbi:MAG: ABC transporter substrate-binding protein [Oscillospiraceae bacterium]
MKKLAAVALSVLLAAGMLAGCANTASSSGSASTAGIAPASGDVSLSVSWWGGDSRHEATQKALEAFSQKYPNITTTTSYGAWTGWEDSMSTALYAGSAQDVNQVNWNWIFNYDNGGKTFVDLNTLSDYIDLSQFSESALEQCTVDGRLSAIPVSLTGRIFYWNESTFEKAGIKTPTSFDELLAAGETFKTKLGNEYYPMAMNELDRTIFLVWALECKYGKNWVEDGKLNYTQQEIAEGLALITQLEEAHVIPTIQTLAGDGAESLDKNPKWMDGRYAGIFEWDSSASKFGKALNEGQSFIVGDYLTGFGEFKGGFTKVSLGFAITQTCKNPAEAAQLINFLLNEEEGVKLMGSERGIPLSKAALEICKANDLLDPVVAQANEKVLSWSSFSLDPTFEDAKLKATDGVYYDVMAGLSYKDYTAEQAAEILVEGINTVLAA